MHHHHQCHHCQHNESRKLQAQTKVIESDPHVICSSFACSTFPDGPTQSPLLNAPMHVHPQQKFLLRVPAVWWKRHCHLRSKGQSHQLSTSLLRLSRDEPFLLSKQNALGMPRLSPAAQSPVSSQATSFIQRKSET
jgi:hypothetical protein